MTFTLRIDCSGAAFHEPAGLGFELGRILAQLAEDVDPLNHGSKSATGVLRDVNGNRVGEWKLEAL